MSDQTAVLEQMLQTPTTEGAVDRASDARAPVMSAAEREQIRAEERARLQSEIEQIRAEARAEVQREHARLNREMAHSAWAQRKTHGTPDAQHGLPIPSADLAQFTIALDAVSPDLCKTFVGMIDRIHTTGLVSFEELGSDGEGEGTRDVGAEWQAAVNAKVGTGMSRSAAIEAVKREKPALFAEYNGSGRTKGGR